MSDDGEFEDHCWKDVIEPDDIALYANYRRPLYVGPVPALLAVDLYELVYRGGARPIAEIKDEHPSSCGIHAWNAIEPTKRLFQTVRALDIPVFYTTGDVRPLGKPDGMKVTNWKASVSTQEDMEIRKEWAPQQGDVVITKQRASGFYGTPLAAHLVQLGVDTIIVIGESTSGCVRATAVDAYSHGFHVVIAEECCFDRCQTSHKVSLFDLHHKYADVMHIDDMLNHLTLRRSRRSPRKDL